MKYFIILILFISYNVNANELEILNDIKGEGIKIVNHSKIQVHYTGKFVNGKKFDSSYDRGKPFKFQIGLRQVIEGWDLGLIGMQVGGKRTLIIPPELAYGKKGAGDLIPSNATLIFDIEVIDIQPPGYKIINSMAIDNYQNGNYIFIDIRTKKERDKTGIIPGSLEITAFDNNGKYYTCSDES